MWSVLGPSEHDTSLSNKVLTGSYIQGIDLYILRTTDVYIISLMLSSVVSYRQHFAPFSFLVAAVFGITISFH